MVQVPIDNQILYKDAMREASMEAKANIAAYFEETISRECDIKKLHKLMQILLMLMLYLIQKYIQIYLER